MNVRPAALEPAAAVAACVVGLPAQDVLSRYAERGRGGRLSVIGIDDRPRILEHHRTRTPEFAPNDICRWSLTRAGFRRLFSIIGKPYGQGEGLGDLCFQRSLDAARKTMTGGAGRLERHNPWCISDA